MRVKSVVLASLLLVVPAAVGAQSYAMQGIERYFRVESELTQGRRGPVVAGYVYNTYGNAAGNVRLIVEGLDAGGQVASSTIFPLLDEVPPGNRAYFEIPAPRGGTTYRVRVLSFDPVGRGS
jgi:hypothetical protein